MNETRRDGGSIFQSGYDDDQSQDDFYAIEDIQALITQAQTEAVEEMLVELVFGIGIYFLLTDC